MRIRVSQSVLILDSAVLIPSQTNLIKLKVLTFLVTIFDNWYLSLYVTTRNLIRKSRIFRAYKALGSSKLALI